MSVRYLVTVGTEVVALLDDASAALNEADAIRSRDQSVDVAVFRFDCDLIRLHEAKPDKRENEERVSPISV